MYGEREEGELGRNSPCFSSVQDVSTTGVLPLNGIRLWDDEVDSVRSIIHMNTAESFPEAVPTCCVMMARLSLSCPFLHF